MSQRCDPTALKFFGRCFCQKRWWDRELSICFTCKILNKRIPNNNRWHKLTASLSYTWLVLLCLLLVVVYFKEAHTVWCVNAVRVYLFCLIRFHVDKSFLSLMFLLAGTTKSHSTSRNCHCYWWKISRRLFSNKTALAGTVWFKVLLPQSLSQLSITNKIVPLNRKSLKNLGPLTLSPTCDATQMTNGTLTMKTYTFTHYNNSRTSNFSDATEQLMNSVSALPPSAPKDGDVTNWPIDEIKNISLDTVQNWLTL